MLHAALQGMYIDLVPGALRRFSVRCRKGPPRGDTCRDTGPVTRLPPVPHNHWPNECASDMALVVAPPEPMSLVEEVVMASLPAACSEALKTHAKRACDVLKSKEVEMVMQATSAEYVTRGDLENWFTSPGDNVESVPLHVIPLIEAALCHKFLRAQPSVLAVPPAQQSTLLAPKPLEDARAHKQLLLGARLENEGRLHEVDLLFGDKALFIDVIAKNPQCISGLQLHPKADEPVTMIIIAYTIAIFGTDRVDIGYCKEVADVLEKKHSFFLPARGALDARRRTWAKILQNKFPAVRSKCKKEVRCCHVTRAPPQVCNACAAARRRVGFTMRSGSSCRRTTCACREKPCSTPASTRSWAPPTCRRTGAPVFRRTPRSRMPRHTLALLQVTRPDTRPVSP